MKENTRITTVQITEVERMDDATLNFLTAEETKEHYKHYLAASLKEMLGVDNVVVTDVQDFIRDV